MTKEMRIIAITIVFILLCGTFAFTAYAKELEPCRLCGGKGDYHCVACNNTGSVTCHNCGGTGVWKCPGEDGKGKCDNGYYTCPSCHGDGKNRSGDGKIIDGNCGQCGGKGKLECWTCHGTPTRACDGCNGTGKEDCQVGTCKVSRKYGWKCPDCKGTGFILVGNPMPPKENNDGVRNVPAKGDYIVTNDKTWAGYTYGGSGNQVGNDSSASTTSTKDTKKPSVSTESGSDQSPTDFPPADLTLVPEKRNTDFDIPIPVEHPESSLKPAPAIRVETGKMTDEQQRYYAGLPEVELAQILTNVRSIVATADPGRSDSKTDEVLKAIASKNGYENVEDGQLFPLYFEGHQEIGFPVRVTVSLEKGVLEGGSDLFIYHIAKDGAIDSLGKAEYITYDDGSIASVSFYTSSFSTFFTALKELDLDVQISKETDDVTENTFSNKTLRVPISVSIVIAVVVAALVVIIIILIKKRNANT